jgi:flagellin-like hook-associated protein FlgL
LVAQNIINVGQTALGSVAEILIQMKSLATQSQSAGLVDATDRTSLNTSFQQLKTQVSSLVTNASLNGSTNNLIDGSSTLSVTVNQDGTSPMSLSAQGVTSSIGNANLATGIATSSNAGTMITNLDTLIQAISTAQANLSAFTVGVGAQTANATGLESGLNGAVASMTSIDSTALQTKLQSLNNQQSIDYYLVSQLNTASAAILSIFR